METDRSRRVRQHAYIKKVMKAQRSRGGIAVGLGRMVQEGGGMGADIFRHSLLLIGVVGLVAIAGGATFECRIYQLVLDWVTGLIYSFQR